MSYYYGNSTPCLGFTTIKLTQGTTKGIPVLNWRNGIEYYYIGCDWHDKGCPVINDTTLTKLAIERYTTRRAYYTSSSKCINDGGIAAAVFSFGLSLLAQQSKLWCHVPDDFITHVFGQGAGNLTIPSNGQQNGLPLNQALQIAPSNSSKKFNTPSGTLSTFQIVTDPTNSSNILPPSFASLEFNLPDPTKNVMIDAIIPKILINYYKAGWLDQTQLNTYLFNYATTVVDGKLRMDQSISGTVMQPSEPVLEWQQLQKSFMEPQFNAFCKNDNLLYQGCQSFCTTHGCDTNLQAFCKTGGSGSLPKYNYGTIPNPMISQELLNTVYPKYTDPKYANICGCFMPAEYYQAVDTINFGQIPGGPQILATLAREGDIGGMPKCDHLTTCSLGAGSGYIQQFGNKNDACPALNIQNCINVSSNSFGSGSTNNDINNQQTINCVQNIAGVPPTQTGIPPPQPPSTTIDKKYIAGGIGVLLILLI